MAETAAHLRQGGGTEPWVNAAIALALPQAAILARVMRSSLIDMLGEDFIRTARAKGASQRRVTYKHTLRNALLPVITLVALDFGQLLGGALLIETVFNYRGLGNMMFEAVKSRDYPLLQGGFLLFTVGVLTISLITDLLYGQLDPRVRRGAK